MTDKEMKACLSNYLADSGVASIGVIESMLIMRRIDDAARMRTALHAIETSEPWPQTKELRDIASKALNACLVA